MKIVINVEVISFMTKKELMKKRENCCEVKDVKQLKYSVR